MSDLIKIIIDSSMLLNYLRVNYENTADFQLISTQKPRCWLVRNQLGRARYISGENKICRNDAYCSALRISRDRHGIRIFIGKAAPRDGYRQP
jgi:hypothetical protein